MNRLLFFLALTSLGPAFAADFVIPQQKIVGAEQVISPGELVTLSVSPPEKTPGLTSTSYKWKILEGTQERRFAVDVNGNIFFGAGIKPRTFTAVVAITHLFTERTGDKVTRAATHTEILTATIRVGGELPPPDGDKTPVVPKPDTDASFPAGKYQLARFAYEAGMKVSASGRTKGRALADSFKNIASAIAAGGLKDARAILKQTKDSNDAALGDQVSAWESFSDALEEKLFTLYQSGSLRSAADFATAWNELAQGLEKVK
jgi:hypothetical protein